MSGDSAFLRVELFPRDIARSLDFYTRVLGFTLTQDDRASATPYAGIKRGAAHLGLLQVSDAGGVPLPPAAAELVIVVDDLDAEFDRVTAASANVRAGITEQPWGLRDFRLVDPDGYYLRITHRYGAS